MKLRILGLALVAALASNGAFASNARETVLGRGDGQSLLNKGSFFYDSMYNVFYNPSYINDYKNWVIVEKGFGTGAAPNALSQNQGGFATSMHNVNFGAYMNNDSAVFNRYNSGIRPIDVFVGGDFGYKVGLGVHHAQTFGNAVTAAPTTGSNGHLTVVSLGAQIMDFDPFFHYVVMGSGDSAITGAQDLSMDMSGYMGGLRYHYGEWTPYAVYSKSQGKNGNKLDNTRNTVVGLGRSTKIGENARLVYSVAYNKTQTKAQNMDAVANGSTNADQVPAEIGVEGDVLSWLTLRGGVGYRFWGNKTRSGDNTYARIGAGFHVNKVDIDWAFGANSAAGTAQATSGSTQPYDASTIGFDSQTFSRVSLSYKW